MKALFVGLGSIGTRHLKNLHAVCAVRGLPLQAEALRHSNAPLPPEAAAVLHSSYTTLPVGAGYDVAFITNPTQLHGQILAELKGRVQCFFIEKPIFESTAYSLSELGLLPTQKAYVAAPMRWCGVYAALKQALVGCRPYSVRAICSSYLPGWRPKVDYRNVYSAKRAMGGGVTLDLIHEWDYLVDLFGMPQQSVNFKGKFSHLEIDADDLSVYIARWPSFLGELHLDYFGREYRRKIEILCEAGTLQADFGSGMLTLPDGSVQDYSEPPNRRYEREMDYFVTYALGKQLESCNSPAKALQTLQLTLGELYE